jgi:GNAT superfamily N-acetyltransferase
MLQMYSIRRAFAEDLCLLPGVERAAAQLFRESPYPDLADSALAADSIDPTRDRVWVLVNDDAPVAFAIIRTHKNALHIQEIDVHPAHARKGLGGRLIREMAKIAKAERKTWLTLTTMSDVAWNGPYYARLGFKEVDRESAGSDLQAILIEEEKAGIPMTHRICMRLKLS